MQYNPFKYQTYAESHIIDNPENALFLDMGLGKTVITLTAIDRLLYEYIAVNKVLVIAPKRVAESTWTAERDKWDHLKHLRISVCVGTEFERKAALRKPADIYVINRENVPWLVGQYGTRWPFDYVVIDELSSFKASDSLRFRQLRKMRPFIKRITGLTGTPAPNNLLDLWSQMYLIDQGKRLGETKGAYQAQFFYPAKRITPVVWEWELKKDENKDTSAVERAIYQRIGDICISMRARDYLQLPERINRRVDVKLAPATFNKYRNFEREQILLLSEEKEVSAFNAAALCNKLLQFANGAVYDEEREAHQVHDEKLDALEEIIDVANGQSVMVFYWYKHDAERIKARLKAYKPQELKTDTDIQRWNKGEISVLLVHPQSAGHGLNLQAGGNIIVWFGLTWSLELYQQANARLDRQGQTKAVIVHHLVAAGTIDEDVMAALERKEVGQDALLNAVKVRKLQYLPKVA